MNIPQTNDEELNTKFDIHDTVGSPHIPKLVCFENKRARGYRLPFLKFNSIPKVSRRTYFKLHTSKSIKLIIAHRHSIVKIFKSYIPNVY